MTRTKPARLLKLVGVVVCLYVFFLSVGMMGTGFKDLGKGFADSLIRNTTNPALGLVIGILATSVVQSSSLTTSMIVTFVGAGALSLQNAIPMVMGANLGTTVTSTIVSLGHVHRRAEFRRAMEAGTVHDFFNILTVVLLFPLEVLTARIYGTGVLEGAALRLSRLLSGGGGGHVTSPISVITKPVVAAFKDFLVGPAGLEPTTAAGVMVAVSFLLLFTAMYFMVKFLKALMLARASVFFDQYVGKNPLLGMAIGALITVFVQSSSITTSILVPMAGAGIITTVNVFPIVLGCNVGTTVTAILASMAVDPGGGENPALAIALAHLLFNVFGILLIYPFPPIRNIPLRLSKILAYYCAYRNRLYAIAFVVVTFFLLPGLLIVIFK